MTFFYDLNKRMAELSQKQTLAEGTVAERATGDYSAKKAAAGKDIGKPGKNFSKIAADAGQRYGSKAAGKRVAGAVLNKLRHPSEGMDEAVRGLTVGNAGIRPPVNQAERDIIAKQFKQTRATNRADTTTTGYGNRVAPQGGRASADNTGSLAVRTEPTYHGQETPVVYKDTYYQDAKHTNDRTGKLMMKPSQGKGVAGQPGVTEADLDEVSRGEYIKQQDTAAEKSGKQKFNAFGQTFDTDEIDEGGLPMTTVNGKRVPKFAADGQGANDLAKKKSFNDKIAGAKQEVEEMLGDVAAEAMRSALGGKKQMADEGFDDMERDVKRRLSTPKVGDVRRGARHDIETTATGVRATRRHDDEEDAQPTGEKRRAGRPKGADKGPERVTGKAYKHKGGRIKEEGIMPGATQDDTGEYGNEGDAAKDDIHTIVRHARALEKILSNKEDLPEWVQAKLTKIEGMMTAVDDYMQTQHERGDEMSHNIDMEEESTNTRDNRAERAGRKVAKDIEYDEKKKDGIHGAKRGSEDTKAEKAGKRVTKDIEYDEKKKEKKVAETTTSGSVATGGDAVKSTKGGVQIGKGIYDSLNRKLENMIAESMSINVSMTNDDNGSHKNITVTAADEDAEALAQLLARAGLGGGMSHGHDHSHEEPCPACGSTDCGCDDVCPDCGQSPCACDTMMDEAYGDTDASQNKPNWPTNTEYSDDAMQYSGGLNKPKASGMATIPVTDVQIDGMDKFGEINRLREMAGIKQQELKPWERTMKEDTIEEDELDEGWKEKMAAAALAGSMALGAGGAHAGTSGNQDAGSNTPQQAAGQTVGSMAQAQRINYQLRSMINTVKDLKQQNRLDPGFEKDYNQMQTVSNTGSPDSKVAGDFANAKMLKQLFQKYNMTLPYVQEDVAEGVVDTVKGVVKKGLEKLGHGSDEDMRKDLQKKMGVPATGQKPEPKDDKKMQESLMKEFANFKI